jgi:hypothetical protein
MWNDKVEATPATKPHWLVPVFFVALAAAGAVALFLSVG